MQRRDRITIEKIISEMDIGIRILGNMSQKDFIEDEVFKRALSMTVHDEYPVLKKQLEDILQRDDAFHA